jgi:hypothetical protein
MNKKRKIWDLGSKWILHCGWTGPKKYSVEGTKPLRDRGR